MIGDLLGGGTRQRGDGQGGTVVASFQMAGDIGTVSGPVAVGFLVDSVSYSAAFALAAAVLGLAAVAGLFAPETRESDRDGAGIAAADRAGAGSAVKADPVCVAATPGGQPHADPA